MKIQQQITEASTLTPEEKMGMWHDGTRGLNIPACGDAKLKLYYDICIKKCYTYEATQLRNEAKNRGLSWANSATTPTNKATNSISEKDFTDSIYYWVINNHPADLVGDIIDTQYTDEALNKALIYLMFTLTLKLEDATEAIVTHICDDFNTSKGAVKVLINNLVNTPGITEKITEIINRHAKDNLKEDIEKHNELNPKLFEHNLLKKEVRDKIFDIVDEFTSRLEKDEINFNLKDIILVGSNCSYNYTKDSDLDIHILAETNSLNCPDNLYPKLYSAYRSLFNKNIDIDFYGIPVELYVQTEETPMTSNGIYSVLNNMWLKEPVQENIPEIDKEAFDKEFKIWEDRYNKIISKSEKEINKNGK